MIALIPTIIFLCCIAAGSSSEEKLFLDGISVPFNATPSLSYFPTESAKVVGYSTQFLGNYSSDILSLAGKNKTDPSTFKLFDDIHRHWIDFKVIPDLPDGYLYFGNNKNYENAPYFFKTNPFYIASLRSGPNMTYEIDPLGKRGVTYFSQMMACLSNTVPRVSATFDSNMKIIKLRVYNATNPKKELTGYTQELAATFLLYQSTYFGQILHSTSHVHNFIVSSGMDYATTNTSLNSWARTYMFQAYLVYTRIQGGGLAVNGLLAGAAPNSSGFDTTGDRPKVLGIVTAILREWCTYKTADDVVKKLLMKHIDQKSVRSSGVGRSFLKQLELVAPFSRAMEKEFKKDSKFESITCALKTFLDSTGTGNSIDSMRSWLEVNTITSMLHGCSLSLLRLIATHSMISVNSFGSSTFTPRDAKMWRAYTGGPLETSEEWYPFSDHIPSTTNPYNINKVLQFYDKRTTALKSQVQKEITQNAAEYKTYGWILSDFGPNFKDGKQLSYTGYF